MVSIGTPHHGAPLERGSNWLDYAMDLSPYVAPFTRIGKKRSAGITDLGHGSIADKKQDFIPLPSDVECYAMASTLGKKRGQINRVAPVVVEDYECEGAYPIERSSRATAKNRHCIRCPRRNDGRYKGAYHRSNGNSKEKDGDNDF